MSVSVFSAVALQAVLTAMPAGPGPMAQNAAHMADAGHQAAAGWLTGPAARPGSVFPATSLAPPAYCGGNYESDSILDRRTRFAAQNALVMLGYRIGPVDGLFGPRTRAAINDWQLSVGCRPTGFLTHRQIEIMRNQAASTLEKPNVPATEDNRPPPPGKPKPRPAPEKPKPKPETKGGTMNPAHEKAKAQEDGLQLNGQDRLRVEKLIADLGLDPGTTDGVFDQRTRKAISELQRQWGFQQSGYLDDVTYVKMLSIGILR